MCSGLKGLVGHGASGVVWALPISGSMSMMGHDCWSRSQPWSHGDFPEYLFLSGEALFLLPSLEDIRPQFLLGVAHAVVGDEAVAGDFEGLAVLSMARKC